MDYDEALGWAGLKLVRADSSAWRIEETPVRPRSKRASEPDGSAGARAPGSNYGAALTAS